MILHPGILALLVGGLVSLLLIGAGAYVGVRIAWRWNPLGAEAEQLALERQGWLVGTLVRWAVLFEACSLLLFLYTADILHNLFVGAMCTTGVLNANPIGWHLLWIKLLLFLSGSLWLVTDKLDRSVPAAPLVRFKFFALFPLLPLVAADLIVTLMFFLGLHPEIITSCCGALFSAGGGGVASELAALPVRPMIVLFYVTAASFAALLFVCLNRSGNIWRVLLAVAAAGFAGVALASVVSFISVYFYRLPSHHCPFDLLQGHYHFLGYPLYGLMFVAIFGGCVPLLLVFLERSIPAELLAACERRWLKIALAGLAGLMLMVSWPLLYGDFSLRAYL